MADDLIEQKPLSKTAKWSLEKREEIHKNPWYSYLHDSGKTDSGKKFDYFYVGKVFSVGAIALTEDRKLILVRQYRYLTQRDSLEVPGGGGDLSSTPEQVIKKELVEETGYEGKSYLPIGEFDVANGHSNDIATVYLISGCKKVAEPTLDESEEGMTVELLDIDQVFELVQTGKITDGFTLSCLMLAFPHLL